MVQDIVIIDNDENLTMELKELFKKDKGYKFKNIKSMSIDIALKNIPALFIINEDSIDNDILEICRAIRQNEDNSITPIIIVSSNKEKEHRIKILASEIEYFIGRPMENEYLYYTIKNIIRLIYVNRRVSPLTGLPGNVQIDAELKKRLLRKEKFAVLYFDLDNFKAYNDTYGFLEGDEIIKQTARIILKNVNADENIHNFVGHIGGDDFVALVTNKNYEEICQNIILEFDRKILDYFSEEDKEKGYLEVPNRKGIIEEFPLVSLSIGVVEVSRGRFHNVLEIGEIGAQVKHLAKVTPGSAYAINRRQH